GPGTLGPLSSSAGYNTMGPTFPLSCSLLFSIPALGVTTRQWPGGGNANAALLGNDIRALSAAPSDAVTLGIYRSGHSEGAFGGQYRRVYDRFFNGDDIGDT